MFNSSSGKKKQSGFGDHEYERLVREGVSAARDKRLGVARRLLLRAAAINQFDTRIWLWLSATTEDLKEKKQYLEKAIAIDANNTGARKGLELIAKKLGEPAPKWVAGSREPISADVTTPAEPIATKSQTYDCPRCGSRMHYNIEHDALVCESCGHTETTNQNIAADTAEAPLVHVMHSDKAHSWTQAQHHVECEKCGAHTLLPPQQRTGECPYCGSNQLIDSSILMELVDPQVIALIKVNEKQALKRAQDWLNKGLFAPDDLGTGAKKLQLRAAYYPFWTYDGTIEVNWTCEVQSNFNYSGQPGQNEWESRKGIAAQHFDDEMVAGVSAFKRGEVESIEPFNLKDVIEFDPNHLAGWKALTYDISLSDASIEARGKIMKRYRRQLHSQIEPGRQKRNVRISAGNWVAMTYKHVLLPIWIGTYHYENEEYHVLVNGQTGKVGGSKPKDTVKVVGIWLIGGIGLLGLIALLVWFLSNYGDRLLNLF